MLIDEHISTKVIDKYDVVVCGGGIAGISAALASARSGKKTLLIERQFLLGGLATAGIITIYLPLCDGFGRQVSFGIAEELLKLSISDGAEARYPDNWLDKKGSRTAQDKRYEVRYNAQLFAILAEKLLIREGVEILYGTYAVSVNKEEDKIKHIIVENKSGRIAFAVGSVVDATGDCDIANFAGAPCECFQQGNVLAGWFYSVGTRGYNLNMVGASDIPDEMKDQNNAMKHLSDRRFTGVDGKEITEFVICSHDATYNQFQKLRSYDPDLFPVTVSTVPQLRMTRKIVGEYTLATNEMHKHFDDSIGMVSDWRKRGPVYEVPFRTLFNKNVKNLIVAGRCTSVTEGMWDIMRVIPCCAVTGQAAGIAAAMSDDFSSLCVQTLQDALRKAGVVLHEADL